MRIAYITVIFTLLALLSAALHARLTVHGDKKGRGQPLDFLVNRQIYFLRFLSIKFIPLFKINNNNEKLAARLELPDDGAPEAYAIFAHCFTCTKNIKVAGIISKAIAKRGIAVLRFDFTGLGNSEGDFSSTTFSSTQDDLKCAINFLKDN